MKKNKFIILTVLWMAYIFYMSHQIGSVSSNSSSSVAKTFLQLFPIPTAYTYTLETMIRKTAHMLEYSILTWLLFQSLKPYTKNIYRYSFLSAVGYACTDEFHQYFIPGRSALVTDVLIDSIGVIVALLLLYWYYQKRTNASH